MERQILAQLSDHLAEVSMRRTYYGMIDEADLTVDHLREPDVSFVIVSPGRSHPKEWVREKVAAKNYYTCVIRTYAHLLFLDPSGGEAPQIVKDAAIAHKLVFVQTYKGFVRCLNLPTKFFGLFALVQAVVHAYAGGLQLKWPDHNVTRYNQWYVLGNVLLFFNKSRTVRVQDCCVARMVNFWGDDNLVFDL